MRKVAVFVGVVCLATAASAAITEIKITSPAEPPYVVGQILEFEIVSNGNVQGETLEYRCVEPNAAGIWKLSSSMSVEQRFVGNKEAKGTTQEMNMGAEGPIDTYSLTKAFTVIGPDTDKIENPSLPIGALGQQPSECDVNFYVYASGIKMGGAAITGYAEERIRRPAQGFDSGWTSGENEIGGSFNWDTEKIVDHKVLYVNDPLAYSLLPDGTVVDDFLQQNRFVIEDCTGAKQYYYFQERHFQKQKNSANTFTLVEV